MFDVSCPNCILANCISLVDDHTHVLVFKQPSFVMLPIYVHDPWFDDKVLQVFEELEKVLSREKCLVRFIIAGITALVIMLNTTVVAAVTFSQSSQFAEFVNKLSKNVCLFNSRGTEDRHVKMEHKLNALVWCDTIFR